MGEINQELKEKLREPIKRYIDYLAEQHEEPPTTTIRKIKQGKEGREEYEVSDFSGLTNPYDENERKFFTEVSEWFSESNTRYKESAGPPGEWEQVSGPQLNSLADEFARDFIWLAESVLQHTGKFEFGEEEYDRAYQLEMGFKHDIPQPYRVLMPISNLTFSSVAELSTDFYLSEDDDNEVKAIQISPITEKEISGIYTTNSNGLPNSGNFRHSWTNVVRVTIDGKRTSDLGAGICSMVGTALRLFMPDEATIGKGDIATMDFGGLSYREDIIEMVSWKPSGEGLRGNREFKEISENRIEKFEEFWNQHSDYMYTGHPHQGLPNLRRELKSEGLARALRRFNQTYTKSRIEDAIIDAVIGFEGTIIKDGGKIPNRGTVLLEDSDASPTFIYSFLYELWDIRNGIVHHDKGVNDTEINGCELAPHEVLKYARKFLAETLIKYIELKKENPDMSVQQISQNLIRPLVAERLTSTDS